MEVVRNGGFDILRNGCGGATAIGQPALKALPAHEADLIASYLEASKYFHAEAGGLADRLGDLGQNAQREVAGFGVHAARIA